MVKRAAAVLVVFVAALHVGSAQDQPPQPQSQQPAAAPAQPQTPAQAQSQQPTFREQINFVRVDVIVSDGKQQPVLDLKQSDFEVLEDGKPQSVEQFRLIKIDGNVRPGEPPPREIRNRDDEEAEAAKEEVRLFLFFFDDYHVRLGNSLSLKEPLTRFVQTQLRPTDMVAIMYPLTPVDGISFTRNFDSVISAINRFEGRKFRYEPRNQFEEQYSRYPTETVENIRNLVVMDALRGAATRLGSLREGRKSIIYVSEGLTAMLPPQLRNADASMPAMPCLGVATPNCNPAIGRPMVGENSTREETARWFAQSDLYSRMRDVFDAANRNNAAIYSLDPRGLATNEFGIDENIGPNQDRSSLQMTQDTLRVFSEETDGRAIVNRNDLVAGLAQVVRDASAYYLIGYTSAAAPTDGKYHKIDVRVKRRGVDVRARKGYWAATVADAIRASNPVAEPAKPIQTALASISTSVQSGKYVRTWIGTERADNGKTRVTLIWEPLPALPGVRRDPAGRVSLLAANDKGDLVFRGRSPDAALASTAPPTGSPAAPAAAGPQRLVFDSAPGNIELRMSVEAAGGGGVLDQEVRKLTIPDFTRPEAVISTPRVHRARTAREVQTLAADGAAVPVAGREFSRTERLLIRFDVYGGAQPSAVLMNREGKKMADLTVTPAAAGGTHQIDMGLNTIPAGEYLIEITAKGGTGDVTELIAVRVTS
jgi:VWFA-related protein